jgi:hypothetical protein
MKARTHIIFLFSPSSHRVAERSNREAGQLLHAPLKARGRFLLTSIFEGRFPKQEALRLPNQPAFRTMWVDGADALAGLKALKLEGVCGHLPAIAAFGPQCDASVSISQLLITVNRGKPMKYCLLSSTVYVNVLADALRTRGATAGPKLAPANFHPIGWKESGLATFGLISWPLPASDWLAGGFIRLM